MMMLYQLILIAISVLTHVPQTVLADCYDTGATYTSNYGFISSNEENLTEYKPNEDCTWYISPGNYTQNSQIIFQLIFHDVEQDLDVINIYNGTSTDNVNLLYTLPDSSIANQQRQSVAINSSSITVTFTSDATVFYQGLYAFWYLDSYANELPANIGCPFNCTNHGSCVNNQCVCDDGYQNGICSNDDILRLHDLYDNCDGSNWSLGTPWDFSTLQADSAAFCNWEGIKCYMPNRVDILDLQNINMNCPQGLPEMPKFIEAIDLSENNIRNIDNAGIGTYPLLGSIELRNASINGYPPRGFLKAVQLSTLDLSHNGLTGSVENFRRLGLLTKLDISYNNFVAFVPEEFEFLPAKSVYLANNFFWCPVSNYASIADIVCVDLSIADVFPKSTLESGENRTVQVTGQFFTNRVPLDCYFGSQKSSVTQYISDTRIDCVVPANTPGYHELTLRLTNRQASRNSFLFEYIRAPQPCPTGTTLDTSSAYLCNRCPSGGVCSGGASPAIADLGYWSSSLKPGYFVKCYNEQSCAGNNTCTRGYEGVQCNKCSQGFFRTRSNSCEACNVSGGLAVAALIVILILMGSTIYSVRHLFHFGSPALFLFYLQTLGFFASYSRGFEGALSTFLELCEVTHFNFSIFQFDCIFNTSYFTTLTAFLSIPLFLPLLIVLVLAGDIVLHKWKKKPIDIQSFTDYGINGALVILELVHVPIVEKAVSVLNCVTNDNLTFLSTYPSVSCTSPNFGVYQGFAIAAVIIYGAGIPILFFTVIYRNRENLSSASAKRRYNSLFQVFKKRHCYFDAYQTTWSLVMMSLPAVFRQTPNAVPIVAQYLLHAHLMVFITMRPMRFEYNNKIAGGLITCMIATLYSIQLDDNSREAYSNFVFAINVCAIFVVFHAIVYEMQHTNYHSYAKNPNMAMIMNTRIWKFLFPMHMESNEDALKFHSVDELYKSMQELPSKNLGTVKDQLYRSFMKSTNMVASSKSNVDKVVKSAYLSPSDAAKTPKSSSERPTPRASNMQLSITASSQYNDSATASGSNASEANDKINDSQENDTLRKPADLATESKEIVDVEITVDEAKETESEGGSGSITPSTTVTDRL